MGRSSIDKLLSDEHYKEFLERAARGSIEEIHQWLLGNGYPISRSAAARKVLHVRPLMSPESIATARAHGMPPSGDGTPRRMSRGRVSIRKIEAALPHVHDRKLREDIEDYLKLIQHVVGLYSKADRRTLDRRSKHVR